MQVNTASIPANSDSQLIYALNTRFPNQGFQEGVPPVVEKALLMWATIYDLASLGRLNDIRPDMLIQHYAHLSAIAASFPLAAGSDNTSSEHGSEQLVHGESSQPL